MDKIDEVFEKLEIELSQPFPPEKTREVWGDGLEATVPGMTIRNEASAEAVAVEFVRQPAAPGGAVRDAGRGVVDVSVMLSIHADGSASMTMPSASVTLSPKRTSTYSTTAEYEMGGVIGKGGMGVIHVARQASLDRRIVIKTIRPEFAEQTAAQEKFITEALATGSLDHPNVVPIHDMGVGEDGKMFYVMKEVKGKNWRELMKGLTEAENIDILQRVCDAVACAHDKGIIHRDLKPENVMIGDYGEVLLMDWGLAAAVSPTAKAAILTNATACAGTPSFMAPEMARGLAHNLGPWSDQYLLGAILYNILTGKPPHAGKNAREGVENAANNVIIPTDRADEWMKVAMRAMSTVPTKRFPSVKSFQKALRNCQVHGESILLSGQGEELLQRARAGKGYEEFARAAYAFEQAVSLWDGNTDAAKMLDETRYDYATRAVDNGDYELALSLLGDAPAGRDAELAARARHENAIREARRRKVRIFGITAVAALVLVALVSGVAYVWIARQNEAERRAREEAEASRQVAEVSRQVAEEQRARAEEALGVAELARRAEAEAKDNELREQQAKLEAEELARKEAENARQRAEEALRAREEIARIGYLEDNSRWRFDADEARRRQEEAAAEHAVPVRMTLAVPGAPMELALVPAGAFVMGSPPRDPSRNNDEYLHDVELSRPFHMGVTEVTRHQWQAVVGVETMESLGLQPGDEAIPTVMWRLRPVPEADAALPATGVSFNDITALFLPRLSELANAEGELRLPSEAEWEWGVRAGTTGHYYTGDSEKNLDECGWYEINSYGRSHPVGQKAANPWGLLDLIGNVAELTLDSYDSLYYLRSPVTDPANLDPAAKFRVCRGGSYVNSPRLCRMSNRTYMHVENRYPHAGFRVVLATGTLNN